MKASFFTLMPYAPLRELPTRWPTSNAQFDPARSVACYQETLDAAAYAEQLGFDWVACAEHHYSSHAMCPNASVMATALAQRTSTAKIAILGARIPLANPVQLAEEYAMVDNLSGGRLIAGLLRGTPYEYLVSGVSPTLSRPRFVEAYDLMLKTWTHPGPFGWEGVHFQNRVVSAWPRPVQQPLPPIFVSGSSKESAIFAARRGAGIGLAFTTIAAAAESARTYRETAREAGTETSPDDVLYQADIYVSDNDEKALAEIEPHFRYADNVAHPMLRMTGLAGSRGMFGGSGATGGRFRDIVAERLNQGLPARIEMGQIFCGGPDSVAAQIRKIREDVGAGVVNLIFQIGDLPQDRVLRSMKLFADEVLPQIRQL
ncbi:LLM class flavin-dependent oxidoreductase [Kribbella solani]|uniref:Alkanesulfonate monooxygenase SsuD/methylene tetrahydromethanopterin reductase-like flavin-dependent oxidoreductase (Luciferase family) n=1 Tax=Kribbella solani TaxID=236067 RepID=A0A841DNB7_9ACTN|nr:LLM class flavin-dependent oxidoreductase [Kribbella solani]MBB5980042.1 alkanesulfonate monooxygenase SsuD/methylene tetrahydromethanopterin reductase-like flavin-dependent oxidoreductase (luciferase family) [Kribbella solani]MDX2972739.1 LLM class flavin-dependent oxidoreductase [Kribbella solani]MDX3005582.1 LLM class flavin-dependent oxidoreductase [Kribbella solani]